MPPYKGAKYNKRPLSALELEERARGRREASKRYNEKNREYWNKVRREYMKEQYHKAKEQRLLHKPDDSSACEQSCYTER